MKKPKILIELLPNFYQYNARFVQNFEQLGYDVRLVFSEGEQAPSQEEFQKAFSGCDACVVCIWPVTAELMDLAPGLKIISVYGAGTDKIDLEAASQRGIAVVNAAGGNAVAVAEMTFGHMLSLSRRIQTANYGMKQSIWKNYVGAEMRGKTYGLMGIGAIGGQVARIARLGFDMKILAYDVVPRREFVEQYGVTYVDQETLFRESDYISIHTPLLPSTRGAVNGHLLGLMKPTAFLVNAARGGVLDEDALYEALLEGRIAGAGLDVYASEPCLDNRFARFENVVNTCHMAGNTVDAIVRMGEGITENIRACLQNEGTLRNVVNPQYAERT